MDLHRCVLQLLVLCQHRSLEGLAKNPIQRGQEYIYIDGGTPSKERHSRVQTHGRLAISSQQRASR